MLFFPNSMEAQQSDTSLLSECGSEFVLDQAINSRPGFAKALELNEKRLANSVSTGASKTAAAPYTVPVVVHVIYDPSDPVVPQRGSTNILDEQIDALIESMNRAFTNPNPVTSYGANPLITFCLATLEENSGSGTGNWASGKDGVTRTASNFTAHPLTSFGKAQLASLFYFTPGNYLNIYVVKEIVSSGNVAGYSSFAYGLAGETLDGIVMDYGFFADNTSCGDFWIKSAPNDDGDVLTHELGHYFGLYHTFRSDGGCEGRSASTCASRGDYCCDTPPVESSNAGCPLTSVNSCFEDYAPYGGTADEPDQVENYMDYTSDYCRTIFTQDQVNRMHYAIDNFRSNLVAPANHVVVLSQCSNPPFGFICMANTTLCIDSSTTITARPLVSGFTYDWNMGDGTLFTNTDSVSHAYVSLGKYTMTITVTDGNTNFVYNKDVVVDSCNLNVREHANWYFGKNASVNFSSGIAQSGSNGLLNSMEACASISDAVGNLMFYTQGQEIYVPITLGSSSHMQMTSIYTRPNNIPYLNGSPNCDAAGNWCASGMQSVVIVPDPANMNSDNYFVFTTSDNYPKYYHHGLTYYRIDMNSGSNGQIMTPSEGIHPGDNYVTTEHLAAIPNCAEDGYWIITHGVNKDGLTVREDLPTGGSRSPATIAGGPQLTLEDSSSLPVEQSLLAYEFKGNGRGDGILSDKPVVSQSFSVDPNVSNSNGHAWMGYIAVSRDGNKVAISKRWAFNIGRLYLYDFNRGTGQFTELAEIFINATGVSFSPDGNMLYVNDISNSGLLQIDISNVDIFTAPPAAANIGSVVGSIVAQMKMGPDDRVYLTEYNASTIGVINDPNIAGAGCNYLPSSITLTSGQTSSWNLPNDIESLHPDDVLSFSAGEDGCGGIKFTSIGCSSDLSWDFDASGNPGVWTSNIRNPVFNYPSVGTYNVCLSNGVTQYCMNVVATSTFYGAVSSTTNIACEGDCTGSATVTGNAGSVPYSYSWDDVNSQTTATATGLCIGSHKVIIMDNNGCQISQVVIIQGPEAIGLVVTRIDSVSGCDAQASVVATGGTPGYSYLWCNGSSISTVQNLCSNGICCVTVTDQNGCSANGCDTITTGISPQHKIIRINIYPNPLTTYTTIETTQQMSSLKIYSISGRLVRQQENLFGNTIMIDRGNLSSGMYFIEVLSKDGVLGRKKVIIQ